VINSQEDIEQDRKEIAFALAEAGVNVAAFEPGTFGYHEIVNTSSLILDLIATLLEHPATANDPEAFRMVHKAHGALFEAYTYMGEKHLPENPERD
jgi:hypothetical protein